MEANDLPSVYTFQSPLEIQPLRNQSKTADPASLLARFNLPWRFSLLGTPAWRRCSRPPTLGFNLPWRFSLLGTRSRLLGRFVFQVFQSPLEIQPLRNIPPVVAVAEMWGFQSPLEIQPLRNHGRAVVPGRVPPCFNLPWRFSLLGTASSSGQASNSRFQSPLEIQPLRNLRP